MRAEGGGEFGELLGRRQRRGGNGQKRVDRVKISSGGEGREGGGGFMHTYIAPTGTGGRNIMVGRP